MPEAPVRTREAAWRFCGVIMLDGGKRRPHPVAMLVCEVVGASKADEAEFESDRSAEIVVCLYFAPFSTAMTKGKEVCSTIAPEISDDFSVILRMALHQGIEPLLFARQFFCWTKF